MSYQQNSSGFLVENVHLTEKHRWIEENRPFSGKIAKGIVFLVAVYNIENRWKAWEKMIKALDPRPEKVIFCENNSDDNTLELVSKWDYPHEIIRFYTRSDAASNRNYDIIAMARQFLLQRARQLNPKYAIFIDDDIFPEDPNFIEKLIRWKKSLVGGTFLRQFTEGIFIGSKWSVKDFKDMPQVQGLGKKVKKIKKKYPNVCFSNCERKLYKVTMTSTGLLSIGNEILQDKRINFYPIDEQLLKNEYSEDFGFCILAKRFGYETFLDGDTRCAHIFATNEKQRAWRVGTPFSFEG